MKRIYLVFALVLLTMTANAQNYVIDLDEIALLGTWNVSGSFGSFRFNDKGTIKTIEFADGNYTKITFANGTQSVDWIFKGYWITTVKTNNCLLHLLPWNIGESVLNFRISEFDNGTMTLKTYDGAGTIILAKDTSASVSAAWMDAPDNGKAYGLNGVELSTPDAAIGIVIQGGKKILK